VSRSADHRAIIGVSWTARDALDAATSSLPAFGGLGLLIPGRRISRTDVDALASRRNHRLRAAILAGQYDAENLATAHRVRQALADAGHSVAYTEVPEGHSQATWRNHLRVVLVSLFGADGRVRRNAGEGPRRRSAR
jgi:enterochelin esterase-like enzyme